MPSSNGLSKRALKSCGPSAISTIGTLDESSILSRTTGKLGNPCPQTGERRCGDISGSLVSWASQILKLRFVESGLKYMPFYRDRIYPHLVDRLGNPSPIQEVRRQIISLAVGIVLEIGVGSGA